MLIKTSPGVKSLVESASWRRSEGRVRPAMVTQKSAPVDRALCCSEVGEEIAAGHQNFCQVSFVNKNKYEQQTKDAQESL